MRCKALTKSGRQCQNNATGAEFCGAHRAAGSGKKILGVAVGALIGNLIAPGVGGLLLGGLAGGLLGPEVKQTKMAKTRVFVSFDFDEDLALKNFIVGQARHPDSPFEIVDHSLKEAAPERSWETKASEAISKSDIVLVMVGAKTYKAHGVLKEVSMARKAGVKIVQIIGYKSGDYTPVPDAGRLYVWSWENLKKLLS